MPEHTRTHRKTNGKNNLHHRSTSILGFAIIQIDHTVYSEFYFVDVHFTVHVHAR